MQLELAAFTEFAEAGANTDEIWSGDRNGKTHRSLGDIVDLVLVQSETVGLIFAVDEMYEILSLLNSGFNLTDVGEQQV